MKTSLLLLILLLACHGVGFAGSETGQQSPEIEDSKLLGKWVRMSQSGPIAFDFKENGVVEADFGNNNSVDVTAAWELTGDTIRFIDQSGAMCEGVGQYRVFHTDHYLSFDLIEDACSGRISITMGFWTSPDFPEVLEKLGALLSESPAPELYLTRARILLATGRPQLAKADFDRYLLAHPHDAKVWVNRAGTRFPDDLAGVVGDCTAAIALDSANKNAWFLRGLARYELGEKAEGCADFATAIELGFSILMMAEQERCKDFWK